MTFLPVGEIKKYRLLLSNLDTAVVVHAPDTRILLSNNRAQELLGLSETDLADKGDNYPEWYFIRDNGTIIPVEEYPVNIVIAIRKPLRYYLAGINHPQKKDIIWVEVNAFPELNDGGKLQHVVVTFTDRSLKFLDRHGPLIGAGNVHSFLKEKVALRSGDKVIVIPMELSNIPI